MSSVLQQLNLPTLAHRRKQNSLILMYQALAKKQCSHYNILIARLKPIGKTTHTVSVKSIIGLIYKYSFIPNTIVAWNALPKMAFGDKDIAPEYIERFTNYLRKKRKLSSWLGRGEVMS